MRSSVLAALVLALLSPSPSFSFTNRDEDCTKCHVLKKEDAETLLKPAIPNVKVLEIRTSPMKTLWEVVIEANGKKIVYVDFGKKYLFSGSIIDPHARVNLTQERFSEISTVDVSKIPLGDAIVMGEKTAKTKVIVFDDPD